MVKGMIMATRVPQKPQTKLEEILADADLEYLGTQNFKPVSDLLFKEKKHLNSNLSLKEWNAIQRDFLESHVYHTDYCRKHKEPKKVENMKTYLS